MGHARADITPPLGVPMGGYANRGSRGCEEIEEALVTDAIYLEQGGVGAVLLAADLIAIDESWGGRVRRAVGERLRIPPEHVVLVASHTHFGPATRPYEMGDAAHRAWLDRTVEQMVETAVQAASRASVATLRLGRRDVGPMMYNRRLRRRDGTCRSVLRLPLPEPDLTFGPVDPKLTVLRFDGPDGRPLALLVSVGIHPVIGGGNFMGISPDYPGVLRRTLEAGYGAPAVFALGTAGNVVPIQRGKGQRERIGRYLAGAAYEASETAEPVPVRLSVAHDRIDLPSAPRLPKAEMDRVVEEARRRVAALSQGASPGAVGAGGAAGTGAGGANSGSSPEDAPRTARQARDELRRLESVALAAERLGVGSTIPFEITAIGLGDFGICCLPGEIFAETGLEIQARSPFVNTLVLSLANQSTGYLATRTALWEGGYEASVTLMSAESEGAAVDNAVRLLIGAWERGLDVSAADGREAIAAS